MVLHLKSEWKNFEDYLAAMSSKYRIRFRRAQKKGRGLQLKNLSLSDLEQYQDEIFALYKKIAENADFNLCLLHPSYFIEMKSRYSNIFQVSAYFDGEKLIGFYTTIKNNGELEAHFMGFDPAYNASHQLYLNMLYRMIEQAFEKGSRSIVFARTAMEIKSSVGAQAENMLVYFRHNNKVVNALMPVINRILEPESDWQPRHPFKS